MHPFFIALVNYSGCYPAFGLQVTPFWIVAKALKYTFPYVFGILDNGMLAGSKICFCFLDDLLEFRLLELVAERLCLHGLMTIVRFQG